MRSLVDSYWDSVQTQKLSLYYPWKDGYTEIRESKPRVTVFMSSTSSEVEIKRSARYWVSLLAENSKQIKWKSNFELLEKKEVEIVNF